MNNTKHTPGPWIVYKSGVWSPPKMRGEQINIIANCNTQNLDGCDLANATLIAAAPELLEALKAIVKEYVNDLWNCVDPSISQDNIEKAKLAIAKAEGKV